MPYSAEDAARWLRRAAAADEPDAHYCIAQMLLARTASPVYARTAAAFALGQCAPPSKEAADLADLTDRRHPAFASDPMPATRGAVSEAVAHFEKAARAGCGVAA